jgi:hypothetical protein
MSFMTFVLPAVSYEQARDNWVTDYWKGQERTQPQPQPGGSPRVDEQTYAAMSGAEKILYARGFPQTPLDHGRR